MPRFDDRTVIVTGAASGIGAATARRFADEGARTVLFDRAREPLQAVAAKLDRERTLVVVADVSVQDEVERAVRAAVERFGALDVLVNNAGIAPEGPFLKASVDDWRAVMATDVDGVFFGCRAALPHLLRARGSIVNVSSVSGLAADWGLPLYNAAKGAVSNLTRALALEFGGRGVRVNAVAPSLTFTGMTRDIERDPAQLTKFAERIALRRGARPEEVASVIAFLASEDASFVNGVVLPVDGGLTASNGQPAQG